MTSELQRAVQTVEDCIKRYGDEVDWVEWQRIRARLTPDRERIAAALDNAHGPMDWDYALALADAINAMGEP